MLRLAIARTRNDKIVAESSEKSQNLNIFAESSMDCHARFARSQ
ncbi:hypothetical protein [Helicobacter sp. 23-1045]